MAYELNEKIRDLKPYDPIQGSYQIRLDANESFFNMPNDMLERVQKNLASVSFHRYPDPLSKHVCTAFASYYRVDPKLVTAYNGSDESLFVIMTCFLMKGDKVMTLSEDFSMYRFYVSLAEGQLVEAKKRPDSTIDVDALIHQAQQEQVKLIVFSNPCNPTSLGLSRENVRKLIRSVDALVVLDEAYMDFWDQSLVEEAGSYENLILLRTCSKAFGMAGIRLGFSVANEVLTTALRAVKSPYNSNSLTQMIGTMVYENGDLMRARTEEIIASRSSLQQQLSAILKAKPGAFELLPSCTNFVYLKTEKASEIYRFFLGKSIAVRCFANGSLRITAGTAAENEAVLTALKTYFSENSEGKQG